MRGKDKKGAPQCEGTRNDGGRCRKAAVVDVATLERYGKVDHELAGRLCLQHLLGEDEWRELASRGGKARAAQRRAEASPRPRSGIHPELTMDDVYGVIVAGLSATFADAGLPNEIDWTTRLLSCAALLSLFPRGDRRTPEQVREILERALPPSVLAGFGPRATPETIRATAREQWRDLKRRSAPLATIYDREPPWISV
jgi:hypothetical protein